MTEYHCCDLDPGIIVDSKKACPYILVDGIKLCLSCFRELLCAGLLNVGEDDDWHANLDNPKDLLLF